MPTYTGTFRNSKAISPNEDMYSRHAHLVLKKMMVGSEVNSKHMSMHLRFGSKCSSLHCRTHVGHKVHKAGAVAPAFLMPKATDVDQVA